MSHVTSCTRMEENTDTKESFNQGITDTKESYNKQITKFSRPTHD